MRTMPVGSLETLLETLDHRRPALAAHSRRVAVVARHLGVTLGLPADEMAALVQAALVHEAGALVGRLEAESEMHGLQAWCGLSEDVDDVLWYATRRFDHHRHAPLAARLLAVAHAFDELTAAREYHVPLSQESARMALAREAGRRFCPVAVMTLIAGRPEQVDAGLDVRDLSALPESLARLDADRLDAARPMTTDYRLVTTS
jgi:HD-GYP domain-containing protein (c-di-GMP phosphodiesterase class II)